MFRPTQKEKYALDYAKYQITTIFSSLDLPCGAILIKYQNYTIKKYLSRCHVQATG